MAEGEAGRGGSESLKYHLGPDPRDLQKKKKNKRVASLFYQQNKVIGVVSSKMVMVRLNQTNLSI